jgi:CBS domain-containing protein
MAKLRVADIMAPHVVTVAPDDDLELAEQAMEAAHLHHLPVVSGGRLVGLIARADIRSAEASTLADVSPGERQELKRLIRVEEVMSRAVVSIERDAPAQLAADLLARHGFGGLPVIDGERVVGLITQRDFLDLVIRALGPSPAVRAPMLHA